MSIINIVANLLALDYPSIYLVRIPSMDDAETEGSYFSGEIHVKIDPDSAVIVDNSSAYRIELSKTVAFLLALTPLAIIGGLSHFRSQKSTSIQRGFTMSWVVLGIFTVRDLNDFIPQNDYDWSGQLLLVKGRFSSLGSVSGSGSFLWRIYFALPLGVAAIGGMVVVGKMINEFGICTWIG